MMNIMPLGTGAAYDVGAMGALGTTGYDTLGTGVDLNAYGGRNTRRWQRSA